MKKPDYSAVGEISSKEVKQSRERALKNLEKAKKIEAMKIQAGKKYVRIDKRTLILR